MNIQKPPVTAPERSIGQLVQRAGEILRTERGGVPDDFAERLFARASAEEIAGFATEAWRFMAQRRPGAPKIRIYAPEGGPGRTQSDQVSVLEIINDDMPFLVDSVMAELTARHAQIRLVVHPVFAVVRD